MPLFEQELRIPKPHSGDLISHVRSVLDVTLGSTATPLRFAVTASDAEDFVCELGVGSIDDRPLGGDPILKFVRRSCEGSSGFNAVLLVPTGIGAEIGGHAGDAGPLVWLFDQICDRVITHPNVVNASDINEIPSSAFYVEGSVIARLLMGTVALAPSRANRVLVLLSASERQGTFVSAAINSINAARATYGLTCSEVVVTGPSLRLRARYSSSGRATGRVEGFGEVCRLLADREGNYDAIAISSTIDVPHEYHRQYFERDGDMVNPWGGVEALLTHGVSSIFNVPSAHSPMFETEKIANMDPGVVDPRMAAEAVSVTFLQCVLKGLHRSPRIVTDSNSFHTPGTLSASDVSCLVIPNGCLGLPTLGAMRQGIPVIAVCENRNLMRNDLRKLPWSPGQLHVVENYWEAAGVAAALKAGIDPACIRRPLAGVHVVNYPSQTASTESTSHADIRRDG